MTTTPTRRTVAKTTAWSIPAVVVGSAAPAMAASCNPETNITNQSVTLNQSSSDGSAPDYADMSVTYTNTGSTSLPAGSTISVRLDIEGGTLPQAAPTTLPATAKQTWDAKQNSASSETVNVQVVLATALAPQGALTIMPHLTNVTPAGDDGTSDYGGSELSLKITDTTPTPQSTVVGCATIVSAITVSTHGGGGFGG